MAGGRGWGRHLGPQRTSKEGAGPAASVGGSGTPFGVPGAFLGSHGKVASANAARDPSTRARAIQWLRSLRLDPGGRFSHPLCAATHTDPHEGFLEVYADD